jgi:N-acetylglutamate synthase-like GNAT family acetyltransferase
MPIKIIDYNSIEYREMINLRMEILRKPLGLSFTPETLEKEKEDILIGAFDDEKITACCILTKIDSSIIQLRQMAVHPKMERNGLGASILAFAENIARDAGFRILIMHARKTAVGFYEKQGYEIHGDEFLEVSIPHYEMRKKLS